MGLWPGPLVSTSPVMHNKHRGSAVRGSAGLARGEGGRKGPSSDALMAEGTLCVVQDVEEQRCLVFRSSEAPAAAKKPVRPRLCSCFSASSSSSLVSVDVLLCP